MKFNSKEQEAAYRRAMKHAFKAVAFDIDGTLTKLAKLHIPRKLGEELGKLIGKVPFVICSGRDIDHIKLKVSSICDHGAEGAAKTGWEKYFVICENGGSGYEYNCRSRKYKKIFEITWPDDIITPTELSYLLNKKFPWKIKIAQREHSIVLYFHSYLYFSPPLAKKLSSWLARATARALDREGLSKYFSVEDSGIGTIVIPKESGKGKAIMRLSKLLKIKLSDFLVVGDMPEEGKNDCEFLSGKYGTAFTVGKQTKNIYPLPVYNSRGKKMTGPEGTYHLLRALRLSIIVNSR